jgi:NADH:ubiquinone oxidoreductase subunit C
MPIEILIKKLFIFKFLNISFKINKLGFLFLKLSSNKIEYLNFLLSGIKYFFNFKIFIDLITIDWPLNKFRFEIIYNFLSIIFNIRLFIILNLMENTLFLDNSSHFLYSCVPLYKVASWLERENWDMFGIFFFFNNDLRRILTDYGFEGFPLRKDFPLTGFLELRYDEEQKSIIYENVELSQEFRFFDFESPWNNHK